MSNIPKLRFPEFTDAWEKCKLGEVAKRVKGNDGDMSLPTLTISAGSGWLDQKDRFSGNIAGSEQKNYTLLKRGQLSYNHGNSKLAKYGAVFVLRTYEKALVPRVYHSFTMLNNADADFIEFLFATKIPDKELVKKITSGARTDGLLNISFEGFMDIAITIPTLPEQQKIGNLFKQLDRLITLHKRKWDDVILLKKALLQKMFPKNGSDFPEIRFPEFTDAWEKCKLGEVARFSKGSGYSKNDLVEHGKPIILYGRLYTNYQTIIDEIDTFTVEKNKSVISEGNEVLIPASGESAEEIARASAIEKSGIILGGDLNIIKILTKLSPHFLAITLSNGNQKLELSKKAQGKSVVHLRNSDLETVVLLHPTLPEQQKIGNLFKQLDRLITLHKRQHEHYQLLKKALLQQMFI